MRRDFDKVLSFIKANALLYQLQREEDGLERIVATVDDYQVVYGLVQNFISEAVQTSISKAVRETVSAVEYLLNGKSSDATVSLTQLSNHLGLDKSAVSRRVKAAIDLGYLNNLEDHRGKPARLVIGDKMPKEDAPALPHPDLVKKLMGEVPPYNSATVQHLKTAIEKESTLQKIPIDSQLSFDEFTDLSPYPYTSQPCYGCGKMAWRERPENQGGGWYCANCHP